MSPLRYCRGILNLPNAWQRTWQSPSGPLGDRRSYTKPSKPRTGRFNARGQGRSALAACIEPNRSWQTFAGCNIRYRSRRAIVKVRVMKLRGGKARAAYRYDGHGRRVRTVLYKDIGRIIRCIFIHLANHPADTPEACEFLT